MKSTCGLNALLDHPASWAMGCYGPRPDVSNWPEASVSSVRCAAAIRPELGVKPTCQDSSTDAFDPNRTFGANAF